RDYKVTGVQTCALPICTDPASPRRGQGPGAGCRGRRRRTSQQLLYQFAPPRRATGRTRPPRRETRRLKPGEGGGVMTAQMLAGRVALVTGGARGIGLACATAL